MLQMHLGQTNIARVAQIAAPVALRKAALYSGAPLILLAKCLRRLPFSRRLECNMLLLRADGQAARAALGFRTIHLLRTSTTGRRGELNDNSRMPVASVVGRQLALI